MQVSYSKSSSNNLVPKVNSKFLPKKNSNWKQDLTNVATIVGGLFAGTIVGAFAGTGIEGLGFRGGACLGGSVGAVSAVTAVLAEEFHVGTENKKAALLTAGGAIAGAAGLLTTKHGVIAVSEAVGAGVMATLVAISLGNENMINTIQMIGGASIAGGIAGASEATKVVAGAAIGGAISILANSAKTGFGNLRLMHARDGIFLGALIGKIFEASGALGDSASVEIIKEAGLAGAGLGAVLGAAYAEGYRRNQVSKSDARSKIESIEAVMSIGVAAGAGGYMTNFVCRYIVPLFKS